MELHREAPKTKLTRFILPRTLHATIYHCLGLPKDAEIHDGLGRPLAVYRGEPVKQILG